MAEYDRYSSDNKFPMDNAFMLNSNCIIALGESLQAMPAIAQMLKEMIHGLCHQDSDAGKLHAAAIDRLRDWVWNGRPGVSVMVPDILVPIIIALDKTTYK